MKVLQINATYATGSTGVIVQDISEYSTIANIQSYVAYPKGHGNAKDNFYEIGSILDHKLHAILCRIAGKQGYFSYWSTKRLIDYIAKISPDIVHLHNIHSNYINTNMLFAYLAKKNIATVITLHDCWFFTGGCFHYTTTGCQKWKHLCGNCPRRMEDFPALLYDASREILEDRVKYLSAIPNLTLVGCSKWIAGELAQSRLKDVARITYIHNGIDLDIFKPRQSNLKKRLNIEDKFVILGPATKWLSAINKGTLDYFVANLPNDTVLLLFGVNGSDEVQSTNVIYYGYTQNREELAELYSAADVMVNCSHEDTLSTINLEAQACGTPVVTYDATGNKETVDGKCGWAIESGNFHTLFIKTMNIKKMGKALFSSSCLKFITEHFEKGCSYNNYIKLYQQLHSV